MAQEKSPFADGFVFKRNDNAPEFVVGGLSVKVEEAIPFLKENSKNGWVNLSIKLSKGGKYYIDIDTWEPQEQGEPAGSMDDDDGDDLPF